MALTPWQVACASGDLGLPCTLSFQFRMTVCLCPKDRTSEWADLGGPASPPLISMHSECAHTGTVLWSFLQSTQLIHRILQGVAWETVGSGGHSGKVDSVCFIH